MTIYMAERPISGVSESIKSSVGTSMLSKRTGDSKSSLRTASVLLDPMVDIQAVPLLPSLMLEMEWVELGLQAKQFCEFEMQNWSSGEHTGRTQTCAECH